MLFFKSLFNLEFPLSYDFVYDICSLIDQTNKGIKVKKETIISAEPVFSILKNSDE